MDPDIRLPDGFDHYSLPGTGVDGTALDITDLLGRDGWTLLNGGFTPEAWLIPALTGDGCALRLKQDTSGSAIESAWVRSLGANAARSRSTALMKRNSSAGYNAGIYFTDGASYQLSLTMNAVGQLELRRGGSSATLIATSAESFPIGTAHNVSWDIGFHNATGYYKVWIDGDLTTLDATGVDTCATANNHHTHCGFGMRCHGGAMTAMMEVDHFDLGAYLATGGAELPVFQPIVQTDFVDGDDTTEFNVGPTVLGYDFSVCKSNQTQSPGANRMLLQQFTPEVDMDLESVGMMPRSTSGTAKFKAVLYSDNAGSPNARVATGTEVIGCAAGTALAMPFAAGQALVGGTPYWIGYITDTDVAIQKHRLDTTTGWQKANTYSGGAPDPAGAMAAGPHPTHQIWGNCSGAAELFAAVNKAMPSLNEYNSEVTVGDADLFTVPPPDETPGQVHVVVIAVTGAKTDGGARTINTLLKSGATVGNGESPGLTPAMTISTKRSAYHVDPDTGLAWTPAGYAAADKIGYEIAS